MITVKEVLTKKDMAKFAKYPVILYKDCPYYVPSLRTDEKNTFNPKKNFSLEGNIFKAFLCYKDGVLVGRIAGLINTKHNQITGKKHVRFNRFECIDDMEVFNALIGAVEDFGKQNGMEYIHGPWGFNDTDREGLLTYGFDKRATYATNYAYPYFASNLEKMGFTAESKWLERSFVIPDKPYDRIMALAEKMKEKIGVVDLARTMTARQILKKYGDAFFDTLNEAYANIDGYVPIEGKARKNVLDQFATIINMRYVSFLVDKDDNVAAFGIVMPSIADVLIKTKGKLFPTGFIGVLKSIKHPKELEMGLVGVRNKYRNSGINSILIAPIMKNIVEDKIVHIESNLMLETNYDIQQTWKFAESEIIKRRQTYVKEIK